MGVGSTIAANTAGVVLLSPHHRRRSPPRWKTGNQPPTLESLHIARGDRVIIERCGCGAGACGHDETHNGEMGIVVELQRQPSGRLYAIVDWGGTQYCQCRGARHVTRALE
jgi:hypothetical protein